MTKAALWRHLTDLPKRFSARAIIDLPHKLNIRVKSGLHTGECDVIGEKYSGFAVKPAKKIADQSATDEILVSRTVRDLAAGSGIVFEE